VCTVASAVTFNRAVGTLFTEAQMNTLHDFTLTDIDGNPFPLDQFAGRAVLLVNVASKCGLTPQYTGLEQLHEQYRDRGFSVLGLPCNQFAGQEPGSETEIKTFCSTQYGVTFPMSSKLDVNGEGRHPLYQWLAGDDAAYPGDIKWNFEKFLIGREGQVVARFGPRVPPDDAELVEAVQRAIG
jgi:glutathione peroxidase